MKYLIVFLLSFTLSTTYAKTCLFKDQVLKSKVTWTAFKTKKKIGVSGSFNSIKFSSYKGKTIKSLLSSASFNINTNSVNSNNSARDKIIATHFFSTMTGGPFIKGQVLKVKNKTAYVLLSMNGKSAEIKMNYKYLKNMLYLSSEIDVLDFAMQPELAALAKACADRHNGKTWSNVKIKAQVSITRECK